MVQFGSSNRHMLRVQRLHHTNNWVFFAIAFMLLLLFLLECTFGYAAAGKNKTMVSV